MGRFDISRGGGSRAAVGLVGGAPAGLYGSLMRAAITAGICLIPINALKIALLRCLGHQIAKTARIGPSVVFVKKIHLAKDASIGAFNVIRVKRLVLRDSAFIGAMNYIVGDFSARLAERAGIGNRNRINRGPYEGPAFPSLLRMGRLSKITADHYVNMTASIRFDDYSVLAGSHSQMWTHGFVHHNRAPGGRDEIKGPIRIGYNTYIGSMSCITANVTVGDHVIVGSHSSISKNIIDPGVYVSVALRRLQKK